MTDTPGDARAEARLHRELRQLDDLSRTAMAAVLHRALPGTAESVAARLAVAPRHRSLLHRWLAALTEAGAVRRDEEGVFHEVGPTGSPAPHELPARYAGLGFPDGMARLHRAALERLPDLLSDRVTLADLLPEETDAVTALGAYQRNVFTGRLHTRCADVVAGEVVRHVRGEAGRARVVELGGGSGATTEAVLTALRGRGTCDYVFTDVAPLYTGAAAERLGVRTALLDIDGDFTAQGFPVGSAEVVVAANVLHNATHIPAALRRVRRVLAPGGTLLVVDSAGDCDTVLTSMQFLLSPPASSPHAADPRTRFTDHRAGTDTVFPTVREWEAALKDAGFVLRSRYPDDTAGAAPAGQYLWHATAPEAGAVDTEGLRRVLADRGEEPVCTVAGTEFDRAAVLAAVRASAEPASGTRVPEPPDPFFSDLAEALAESPDALPTRSAPDPGPPPHTLVLVGDPAGAEAAPHAWSRGGHVTAVPAATPPARLLADLERLAATEAVLPLTLVRSLPTAPTAPLTDLSALTRVICAEPGAEPQDAAAWAALGPHLEHAAPPLTAPPPTAPPLTAPPPQGDGDLAGAADPAAAACAADAALRGLDPHAAVDAAHQVARAALFSMLHTLRQAGCYRGPGDRHTPEQITTAVRPAPYHQRLLHRWLSVLTEEGLLTPDGSGALTCPADPETYADLDAVWRPARERWREAHGSDTTVTYARGSAGALLALMRAERSAAALLFPRGETGTARSLYGESATARYQHHAAAALVAGHLRGKRGGVRRVLEAGGGTATTTDVVLPELERLPGARVEYLFTDVSPFFLDHASARFGDRLGYGLLDIDRDPVAQGHAPGSYDVVVAGGVLNAAVDTDLSVRGLARLLAPGGLLVLTEPTREEYWVLASQGFLLAPPRDAREATGASFLTHAQWLAVFDGAGLLPVADLPAAGHPLHPLGHRVFAAVARSPRPPSPSDRTPVQPD